MEATPTTSNTMHGVILTWGCKPKHSLEGVIFYNTKNMFDKHNLGRDVARYVEEGDVFKSNRRYYLSAAGIISLGFGKKTPKIVDYVLSKIGIKPKVRPPEPIPIVTPKPQRILLQPSQQPGRRQIPHHSFEPSSLNMSWGSGMMGMESMEGYFGEPSSASSSSPLEHAYSDDYFSTSTSAPSELAPLDLSGGLKRSRGESSLDLLMGEQPVLKIGRYQL